MKELKTLKPVTLGYKFHANNKLIESGSPNSKEVKEAKAENNVLLKEIEKRGYMNEKGGMNWAKVRADWAKARASKKASKTRAKNAKVKKPAKAKKAAPAIAAEAA